MLSVVLSLRGLTGPLLIINCYCSPHGPGSMGYLFVKSSIGLKARALVRPVLALQRLTLKYRFDSR